MASPSNGPRHISISRLVLDQAIINAYVLGTYGPWGKPYHVQVDDDGVVTIGVHDEHEPTLSHTIHACCIHPLAVVRGNGDAVRMERADYERMISNDPDLFLAPVREQLVAKAVAQGIDLVIE
jgi:hypothetical protein